MAASRKILGYRYNHFQHKFYYSSIIIIIMAIITLHLASSSRQILVVVRGHLPAQHYNSTTTTEMRKSQHIKYNYLFQPQKHWDCIHGHLQEPDEDVYLSFSSCWRIRYNVGEQVFGHSKEIASISSVHSEKKKSIILLLEKIFLSIFISQLVWQRCV